MKNNKVFYLITQFGLPAPTFQHSVFDQATKCSLPSYGATIFPIFLYEGKRIAKEDKKYMHGRYGIYFINNEKKDDLAQKIADCIKSIHTFVHFLTSNESPKVYALPISLLKNSYLSKISLKNGKYLNDWDFQEIFSQWTVVPDQKMKEVLDLLPHVLSNKSYFNALHYYQDSSSDVSFSHGDLHDHFCGVSDWAFKAPKSRFDQVKIENSILNSAKTIEAIIGEPPRDDAKLNNLLKQYNINPSKKRWYQNKIRNWFPDEIKHILKETNRDKIRALWKYRDKIAAHAKTNTIIKDISIFRAHDFQEFASSLLWKEFKKHKYIKQ